MKTDFLFNTEAVNLVAILRDVRAEDVLDVASVLVENGMSHVEIPLNNAQAHTALEQLQKHFSTQLHCGAGTVVSKEQISRLAAIGIPYFLSPHLDETLLATSREHKLLAIPGVMTPSEIYRAYNLGLKIVKVFPAAQLGPGYFKALQPVLPDLQLMAVGGVSKDNIGEYYKMGLRNFGVGSELYYPGIALDLLAARAKALMHSLSHCR